LSAGTPKVLQNTRVFCKTFAAKWQKSYANQRSGRGGIGRRKGLKISGDGLNSQDNRGNIGAVDPAENYADRAGLETPDGRSRRKKIREICLTVVALLFASLAIALAVGLGQRCIPSSEEITIGQMLIAGCRQ
jgi:hypothetical protein